MSNRHVFLLGILGVLLFIISTIVGGILVENYDVLKQYISESYAIDTPFGQRIRFFGYLPSGILIALFCFLATSFFSNKKVKIGLYGVGIFYGIATIIVALFPCDSGCNREWLNPSLSQIIHNLTGAITYLLVPFFILLVGFSLKEKGAIKLSRQSIIMGTISLLFVGILMTNPNAELVGLYQRIVELSILLWIVFCAIAIKNKKAVSKKS